MKNKTSVILTIVLGMFLLPNIIQCSSKAEKITVEAVQVDSLSTKEIYDQILVYFDIRELVSPGVYKKFKDRSDYFFLARFDIRLLENLLWIRINVDKGITINNWMHGGNLDERGLRDTSTPMLQKRARENDPWLSGHVLAMGIDYDVKGQTAEEHREWLRERSSMLPYPIRLIRKVNNREITWVHLDVCDLPYNPKVFQFDM